MGRAAAEMGVWGVARREVELPNGARVELTRNVGKTYVDAWEAAGAFVEGLGREHGEVGHLRAEVAGWYGAGDWREVVASVLVDLSDGARAWVEMREGQTVLEARALVEGLEGGSSEAPDLIEVAELLVASDRREVVARVEVEILDGRSAWAEMREGQTTWEAAENFLGVMERDHGDLGHRREEVADLIDAGVFGDVADLTTRRAPLVFLHNHKAGGTSVNEAILRSGRTPWPVASRGKPIKSSMEPGPLLPIWTYSPDQWRSFWRQAGRRGVNFVEFEWDFFADFRAVAAVVPCDWVTVLRDPYKRFLSDFWFHRGRFNHSRCCHLSNNGFQYMLMNLTTWSIYTGSAHAEYANSHNEPNYYVKVLNGLGTTWGAEVGPAHLEHAKAVLRSFTTVAILEDRASMARLEARYGVVLGHENKNPVPRDRTDEEVMAREDFERLNALDMELYRYAVELVAADGAAAGDQSVTHSRYDLHNQR